jgi:micrococcal nuclease
VSIPPQRGRGWRALVALAFAVAVAGILVPFGAAHAFTDVGPSTLHAEAIAELSSQGIVSGYPDGSFRPSTSITRMQFAKVIAGALQLRVSSADVCSFADVPANLDPHDPLYPDHYVAACAAYAVVRGKTSTTFAPFEFVSEEQLVTMVVRAADLPQSPTSYTPPFLHGQFSLEEHYQNARAAAFAGLLAGLDQLTYAHDFSASATRGEVCQLLFNLLSRGTLGSGASAAVTDVVDGDTIRVLLDGGARTVRLIGIDTPETGEPFATEATSALAALVDGENVRLEFDVEERDQYGRSLAYVWVEKTMVNAEMLRLGLATLYSVPPNLKHVDELRAAQEEAKTAGRGFWGAAWSSPLRIAHVHYDAPGDDNANLNAEYVVFDVLVSGSLAGYSVEDETGHRYKFPDRIFQKGQTLTLHTGVGTDTQTDLYWGMTGSAIWNNSGDTVKVLDPEDRIVASYSY